MFSSLFGNWKPYLKERDEVEAVLERILSFSSEPENRELLEKAREYYLQKVGKTFEDDDDFEQRMNTFVEWYIFNYQPYGTLPGQIFTRYKEKYIVKSSSTEWTIRKAIEKLTHSVFLVKEQKGEVIKVKDLIGRKTYFVTSDDTLEKGDIIQTRIIDYNGGSFFSFAHCLHPKASLKIIKKGIKTKGRNDITSDFFLDLETMQLRWRRSRQIDIKQIYKF